MATLVPQGIGTWTARVTPTDTTWGAVAWSPTLDLFAAVSYDGIASPVITSPTGVTWTARAAGAVANLWNDVIWVPELALFVAVSDVSSTSTNVMTSANGTAWSLRTASDKGWIAVAWNGTTLVAVSPNNVDNIMTSTNGTAWTLQTSSGIGAGLDDIAHGNSVWVGCNTSGGIYSSTNGIDWTLRETPANSSCRGRVVYATALGKFFVLGGTTTGSNGGALYESTDGVTWTRNGFATGVLQSPTVLAWGQSAGTLLVMQSGTATFLQSTNGSTFTSGTGISNDWYDAVWSPDLSTFAAVSIDGSGTDDVATASYQSLPTVTGLSHLEGEAVSVVADGTILASPNNPAYTTITVTSGVATLPAGSYTSVTVGLPITADIQTLDLDLPNGTTKPGKALVTAVGAYVEDSMSFFAGPEEPTTATNLVLPAGGAMQAVQVLDRNDTAVTTPTSGFRMLNFEGRWDQSGSVFIRHVDPTPLTVLALVPYGTFPR